MWQRWARTGLLALSGILSLFLIYILATKVDSVPPSQLGSPRLLEHADAGINHFTFTQSQDGVVQWEVNARQAQVFEDENRAVLQQVHVTLHGERGRELSLKGDTGTIDTETNNFVLVRNGGPIAIELDGGYTIYTNHLTWTDERREISTNDPVAIHGEGLEIRGQGLVGKLDSEEFKVLENVRVEISN